MNELIMYSVVAVVLVVTHLGLRNPVVRLWVGICFLVAGVVLIFTAPTSYNGFDLGILYSGGMIVGFVLIFQKNKYTKNSDPL